MGKYVEKHLHDDEFIVEVSKFSRWKLVGLWLLAILLFGGAGVALFVVPMLMPEMLDNMIMRIVFFAVVFVVNFFAALLGWKGWERHSFLNFLRWFSFIVLTIAAAGILIVPIFVENLPDVVSLICDGLAIFCLAIFLIPLVGDIVIHTHRECVLTNKRIVMKKGVFDVYSYDVPLDKVIDINVEIGFWGRIFNVHQLFIATEQRPYWVKGVRNGYDFKNSLMAQIEEQQESRFARQATWTAQALARNDDQRHAVGYGAYQGANNNRGNIIGVREEDLFDYED